MYGNDARARASVCNNMSYFVERMLMILHRYAGVAKSHIDAEANRNLKGIRKSVCDQSFDNHFSFLLFLLLSQAVVCSCADFAHGARNMHSQRRPRYSDSIAELALLHMPTLKDIATMSDAKHSRRHSPRGPAPAFFTCAEAMVDCLQAKRR